jgi:TRAP-type C4-dicarboxylate transport system permease small subunit
MLLVQNKIGWKNWPYWLKGGIILSGISLIASLGIMLIIFASEQGLEYIGSFIATPIFFFALFFSFFTATYWFGTAMGVANSGTGWPSGWILVVLFLSFFSVVVYFIIGAIIGWVYGKIKNRK